MQNSDDPLVEKILCDLENAIKKHPNVSEFEIIPTEASRNKSPVFCVGNNLGLESWCVKQVYSYIHREIILGRGCKAKHKLTFDTARLDRLLLGGILLNPDLATFWNIRRELIVDNSLDIRNELDVSKLVLSHKPKSNEAFAYRKWIIQRILKIQTLDQSQTNEIIQFEIQVADRAGEKCMNNYHAWNYKIWLVTTLALSVLNSTLYETLLLQQLNQSEIAMNRAVSDNSVFHYRQQMILSLREIDINIEEKYLNTFKDFFKENIIDLDNYSWPDMMTIVLGRPSRSGRNSSNKSYRCLSHILVVLIYELVLLASLNLLFQYHECIWLHRRFVLMQIIELLCDYYGVQHEKVHDLENFSLVHRSGVPNENIVNTNLVGATRKKCWTIFEYVLLYKAVVENEKKEIECCAMDPHQVKFVQRHSQWLLLNLGLALID